MIADGTKVTEPRLINTHELLTSKDFKDCLGSLYPIFVLYLLVFLFCSPYLTNFPFLCFAEKMKYLGSLVNSVSKKISSKKRHKNVQSLEHLIVGYGPGSTSSLMVDLEGEDPPEELV
jgi:hypothetical protein